VDSDSAKETVTEIPCVQEALFASRETGTKKSVVAKAEAEEAGITASDLLSGTESRLIEGVWPTLDVSELKEDADISPD